MTMALCFHCGNTKFGALTACRACKGGPSGNVGIDIAFSDHRLSEATLERFGEVIKAIRPHCKDPEARFWAFLHYVSTHHPEIIGVQLKPEVRPEIEAILAACTLPSVVVEKSFRAKLRDEYERKSAAGAGRSAADRLRALVGTIASWFGRKP